MLSDTKYNCHIAAYYLCKYMEEHNGKLPSHAHILVNYSKHAISWIDAHEIIVQYIYEEGNKFTQFNAIYLKLLSNHFTKNGISQKSLLQFVRDSNQNIHHTNSSNIPDEELHIKQLKTNTSLNCQSIHKCDALQRITMMLHFFQQNNIHNTKEIIFHCNKSYNTIISDYEHLINEHLNCDKQQSINNYNIIHKRITKFVECDQTKCDKYIKQNMDQNKDEIYVNLLDTIHCYFVHKYNVSDIIYQYSEYKSKIIDNKTITVNDTINIDEEHKVDSAESTDQHHEKTSVCSEKTTLSNDEMTLSKHKSYSDDSNINDTDDSSDSGGYSSSSLDSEEIREIWHRYRANLHKIFYCFVGYEKESKSNEAYMALDDIISFLHIVEISEYWSIEQVFDIMVVSETDDKVNVNTFVEFFCDVSMNSKANDIKRHIEKHMSWRLLLRAVDIFEKVDKNHCGQLEFDKFKQFGKMLDLNDKDTQVLWNSISNQYGYITIVELFEWLKSKMEKVKMEYYGESEHDSHHSSSSVSESDQVSDNNQYTNVKDNENK